jgi:RND family efflux transporter MFP subunit
VYRAAGSVRAVKRAELATRMMTRIETIGVRAGDRVKAGQVLAVFERGGVAAARAQASAGFDLAATNLRRMERLYADSAIPVAQLEAARGAFAQAKGHVDAATAEMGYASLVAPFDGVVASRHADPGDLAAPGQPILVIEDGGAREIVVGVPEAVAAAITPRERVVVKVGAAERPVTAQVAAVVGSADPTTRTVEVRLVTAEPIMANVAAVAEFPVRGEAVAELTVPAAAVVTRGELTGVYLFAPDSTIRLRWIRLGRTRGAAVEVVSGLRAGDLVVADVTKATDGQRARPIETPGAAR